MLNFYRFLFVMLLIIDDLSKVKNECIATNESYETDHNHRAPSTPKNFIFYCSRGSQHSLLYYYLFYVKATDNDTTGLPFGLLVKNNLHYTQFSIMNKLFLLIPKRNSTKGITYLYGWFLRFKKTWWLGKKSIFFCFKFLMICVFQFFSINSV